ncbi:MULTISPECIES: Crp/Fnr family transcriptional regulator [Bacillaceae]|uniref:Crp/Fnr family transcriptional regulator n=1 Tax=Evansella alkalicola TaxID=745819 RepID=A0ABS6JTU3_9BACI|nr:MULTISPECIES: Crp/Fnr family transcriptional regulator [Bacillaceae]MBU9721672.1 Crp/Fnr family transcriptional regulator [Bacillus alkalicola]
MLRLEESLDKMWYLSKIGFFEFLPQEDLEKLGPIIHHRDIKKNTVIQKPDTVERKLFFVKEGALKIYTINEAGKVFTISLLGPYSTYGQLSSFSLGTENVFIETLCDVHLCSITEEDFQKLLKDYPDLVFKAMEILTKRLHEREKMLQMIATGSVKEQIMHLLVSMADTYGKKDNAFVDIPIPLSHQEIANMLGVTRESVSTNMCRLKKEGMIRSTGKKTIEVKQLQSLN